MSQLQQVNQLDKSGLKTGWWEYYYNDGQLWQNGFYQNNFRIDYWKWIGSNGKMLKERIFIR